MQKIIFLTIAVFAAFILSSCGGSKQDAQKADTVKAVFVEKTDTTIKETGDTAIVVKKVEVPKITIYLFHAARRCASCVAIGNGVNEVLQQAFKNEVKAGRLQLIEVDAEAKENTALCEKFEAFGTALFVTRTFQGKETRTDFTAQGFKLAKNKPDEFKQLLSEQIEKDLK